MRKAVRPASPFDADYHSSGYVFDKDGYDESKHPRANDGKWTSGAGDSGFSETRAADFHRAFEAAFENSPFKSFVSHYSQEELGHMKAIVTTPDGKAGFAVKDHGDGRIEVTALYNTSGEKGLGSKMLGLAVEKYGVNYLECFGPHLPMIYQKAGFVVKDQFPFDKEQAPKDWDHARFGAPDYFTMTYKGKA